jgi:hypothetical protein
MLDQWLGAVSFVKGVDDWWKVGLFALGAYFLVHQAQRSFRLARRMRDGKRGGALRAAALVLSLGVRHFVALVSSPTRFFDIVRRRVEFEIFHPRPEWRWPMRDDDERYARYGSLDLRDLTASEVKAKKAAARRSAHDQYVKDLDAWRDEVRKARRNFTIELQLAGELNDSLSDIKLYFDTLKVLHVDPQQDLRFLCPIKVQVGFVASQHLLTGLLIRYNSKWGDIINGFERDTRQVRNLIGNSGERNAPLAAAARDFRQIQSFIYHCWLLWGPSIPVCAHDCSAWAADYTTLQYGYGDENNAIEIVGEHDVVHAQLKALMQSGVGEAGAMAVPASVFGRLQYSSVATLDEQAVPKALWQSWSGRQDERPILFLSQEEHVDEQSPDGVEGYRHVGEIRAEIVERGTDPHRSRYYSAYFWVMFVVLRHHGDEWVPIDPDSDIANRSESLWKASIPFFEHGNMADAASCCFAKRQLAEKAISGIAYLVEEWEEAAGSRFPLRFAYASGIDDANCSAPLAVDALAGGETVAAIMRQRLEEEAPRVGSRIGRLARDGIVDFDFHHPTPPTVLNRHAACELSGDIKQHYKTLDRFQVD